MREQRRSCVLIDDMAAFSGVRLETGDFPGQKRLIRHHRGSRAQWRGAGPFRGGAALRRSAIRLGLNLRPEVRGRTARVRAVVSFHYRSSKQALRRYARSACTLPVGDRFESAGCARLFSRFMARLSVGRTQAAPSFVETRTSTGRQRIANRSARPRLADCSSNLAWQVFFISPFPRRLGPAPEKPSDGTGRSRYSPFVASGRFRLPARAACGFRTDP